MDDIEKVMSWLEELTEPDWREFYSDSEISNIAKAVLELLKERKTGKWIEKDIRGRMAMCCSVCGCDSGTIYEYAYCPNCGADMR